MTFNEMMNGVVNVGLSVALVIVFVWFFIQRAKRDDERATKAQEEAQKKNEELLESARAREDMLIANAERREEILREEARKREEMIQQASEKRESVLMLNMEKQLESMNNISKTLNEINVRMDKIERRLERQ